MHDITISLDELLWIAGFIGAICTVIVYIKKGIGPIVRPFKEIKELKQHAQSCEIKFANDDARLEELCNDMKEVMRAQMLLMKHVETGNCTGEVASGRERLEHYLIDKE